QSVRKMLDSWSMSVRSKAPSTEHRENGMKQSTGLSLRDTSTRSNASARWARKWPTTVMSGVMQSPKDMRITMSRPVHHSHHRRGRYDYDSIRLVAQTSTGCGQLPAQASDVLGGCRYPPRRS